MLPLASVPNLHYNPSPTLWGLDRRYASAGVEKIVGTWSAVLREGGRAFISPERRLEKQGGQLLAVAIRCPQACVLD